MEEMREQEYSSGSKNHHHHHFSSTTIRRMFMDHGPEQVKTYMYSTWVISPTETRRIVLTDSTLYGIWSKKMPKSASHFDIDSIVGGSRVNSS